MELKMNSFSMIQQLVGPPVAALTVSLMVGEERWPDLHNIAFGFCTAF